MSLPNSFIVKFAENAKSFAGSIFLVDPVKEFNMHIDAPAEKEEELYGQ